MRISDWSSDVCSSDLVTHGAIDRRARQRDVKGAIAGFGMGLRRAMAIEQLESGARTERYALVVGVGEVELSVHYNAKLHMVDPAVVETRRRGRADQIGEGDAVVAGAGRSEEHTSELQSLMRIAYA